MEKTLPMSDIKKIRDAGLLSESETAFLVGDVLVAENVVTKVRRVLEVNAGLMLECKKAVLKG
jgi:hypothetical protein